MRENRVLIHDLQPGFAADANFDEVIEDNGRIKNCIGCFTCWIKTPMECVLKDGYEHMAEKLAACDELILLSRCSYGGPSAFVKNVLDRSIPYLHPDFVIKDGQMHHKQRFPQHISIKILFYGEDLTDMEKATAEDWAKAMAVNFDAASLETNFYSGVKEAAGQLFGQEGEIEETQYLDEKTTLPVRTEMVDVALITASPKKKYSTSGKMLEELKSLLPMEKQVAELYLTQASLDEDSLQMLVDAETLVFSFPLYVDGIPSHLLRFLREVEARCKDRSLHKSVYTLINCGFYEGEQTENAMKILENWCTRCGFAFCGGLGVGAGGMWHSIKDVPPGHGPKKTYGKHLEKFAHSIEQQTAYGKTFTTVDFPRLAYKMAGESGWKKAAKKNGIKL